MHASNLAIFLTHFAQFLPSRRICALHAWWFLRKYVLYRKNFIKQLKLLLRYLPIIIVYHHTVELSNVLEPICNEALECHCLQDFVIIDVKLIKRLYAFDFAQKYEGVEVVVGEDELLELCELAQLVEVWVVDNQVEADVG